MRLKQASLFLFAASILSTSAAASPIQVTLTGVNGAAAFGYYVGPYYGTFEASAVTLFCDDFANDAFLGEKWMANLSQITNGSDLSQTRYGGTFNSHQLYQEVAWLDLQFATQPVAQFGDIHATIWDIFDPSEAPKPSSNYWLNQAQANFSTVDLSNFRVVTNVGQVKPTGQVQEFLTIVAPSQPNGSQASVPEPGPMFLIGGGLVGIAFFLRVRSNKRHSDDRQ